MDVNAKHFIELHISFHTGISGSETSVVLDVENDPEPFLFHTVCQDTVVTDLLETGREHMLQESSDKFRIGDGHVLCIACAVVFRPECYSLIGN